VHFLRNNIWCYPTSRVLTISCIQYFGEWFGLLLLYGSGGKSGYPRDLEEQVIYVKGIVKGCEGMLVPGC
jgi:hypothetical protein